jgi:tyrosinase
MSLRNLLFLFDRPNEPIFMPKGKEKAVFHFPEKYFTENYEKIGMNLRERFIADNGMKIDIQETEMPDISECMKLSRQQNFSLFMPMHQKIASKLTEIFINAKNIDELQSIAVYSRDRVNSQLFNYALSSALIHRSDTKDFLDIPLFAELFPYKYIDSQVLERAREEVSIVPEESRQPVSY